MLIYDVVVMKIRCLRCGFDKFEYSRTYETNFCLNCGKVISNEEFEAIKVIK
jgi:ribosomal protein S27E